MADPEIKETSKRDRISELPAPIRQQILSFLSTKQAATTSILSSTWRYDWLNLPCVDFTPGSFNFETLDSLHYLQILDHVLQLQKRQRYSGIRNLSFYLPSLDDPSIRDMGSTLADQWLSFVTEEGKLEELTFHVNIHYNYHHVFPSLLGYILASSNTITRLDLEGCRIFDDKKPQELVAFNLLFLRELSLSNVGIDHGIILENLLAHCPSLENLRLHTLYSRGFKLIRVFGLPKLKYVEVKDNFALERVEIDASNLYHLSVSGYWSTFCAIHVSPSCTKLVNLQLCLCKISEIELNQLLDQLLHLECLKLVECHKLKKVRIASNCLVNLTIMRCRKLGQVELLDPPLKSFVYHIEKTIMSLRSTSPLAPMYAEVHLPYVQLEHAECCRIETEHVLWHTKIVALLGKLSYSKHVSLFMNSKENAIIPQRLRQSACPHPLHGNEHLELSLEYLPASNDLIQCLESLLWLSPRPNYIQISRRHHHSVNSLNILVELQYKEELENEKSCNCYPSQRTNCWRHSLKDFEIREQHGFEDGGSLTRFFQEATKGVLS